MAASGVPDVSVVIPTRDRGEVLRLTLAGALRQRDVELEVIVVDDASARPPRVAGLDDPRVRVIREDRPGGVSAARNRGIAETRGSWVAFLDDDDLWAPEKLVRQLEAAEETGRDWVYAGDVNVDDELRVLSGEPPPDPDGVVAVLPRYNPVPTGASNVVVRTEVLAEVGVFDPTLKRTEDWDLWIRLARHGPPAWVPSPLVAYRFHRSNLLLETASIVREPDVLAERYGIPVDRTAARRRAAWACARAYRRARAVWHYLRAAALGDVRSLGRAVVALTHPAVGSERMFALIRRRPGEEAWRAEARRWLGELAEVAEGDRA
jgi:hypothetical protein